jgi:hypothetical protein
VLGACPRFAQSKIAEDITLARENVLGVVIPEEYKRTPGLMPSLKSIAGIIATYPHMQRAFVFDEMLDALLDVLPLESGCNWTAKIARRIIGGWLLR